jgi:dienelactone hydrolase
VENAFDRIFADGGSSDAGLTLRTDRLLHESLLDQGIPPSMVREFEKQAQDAGKRVDFKIYPGAGHGFASNPDPKVYKADAARDADARTDQFLAKTLKAK